MSGIEDPGTADEVPEEYAAVYRDAYRRALEEDPGYEPETSAASGGDPLGPSPTVLAGLRGVRLPVLVAGAVLVLAVAGLGIWLMLGNGDDPSATNRSTPVAAPSHRPSKGPAQTSGTPSPASTPVLSAADAWDGPVSVVAPEGIEASCTSAPGVDSAGDPVRYGARNTLDADATTAWRCDGSAIGQTLTITLPEGTAVAEVGLIPGYAKTDPVSGVDRYAENNRITRVRWTLADGVVVEQVLDPRSSNRAVQQIRVPRTATGTITMQVLAVKRGPRNTTAISEIAVAAAAG